MLANAAITLIFESAVGLLLVISSTVCLMIFRLSVRAFTKLFDEDHEEFLSPLYTDTYLSKPFMTDAGITHGSAILKDDR